MKRGYFEPTSLGEMKDRCKFSLDYRGIKVTGIVRNVKEKYPETAFFLCHNIPGMLGCKPADHDTYGFEYSWQVNNNELGWRNIMKADGITDFTISYDSSETVGYFMPKDFIDLKDGQHFVGNICGQHVAGVISIVHLGGARNGVGRIFLCQNGKPGNSVSGLDRKGFLYTWELCGDTLSNSMINDNVSHLLVCDLLSRDDKSLDNEKPLNREETTTEIKLIGKNKLLTLNNY